jgi:hypothetical protein
VWTLGNGKVTRFQQHVDTAMTLGQSTPGHRVCVLPKSAVGWVKDWDPEKGGGSSSFCFRKRTSRHRRWCLTAVNHSSGKRRPRVITPRIGPCTHSGSPKRRG